MLKMKVHMHSKRRSLILRYHTSPLAIESNEPYKATVALNDGYIHTRSETTYRSTRTRENTASSPTAHTNSTRSSIARRYSSPHRKSCRPRTRRNRAGRNRRGLLGYSFRSNRTRLRCTNAAWVCLRDSVFVRGYCKREGGCGRFENICLQRNGSERSLG
jgi:hypothetical protein